MRMLKIAAALALAGVTLAGCYEGRPGHSSDHHHGGHHGGHHDHHD